MPRTAKKGGAREICYHARFRRPFRPQGPPTLANNHLIVTLDGEFPMNKISAVGILAAGSIALFAFASPDLTQAPALSNGTALGNRSLRGSYEFHADGVVEINGVPTRGFWESGRFDADGKGNITNGVEYSSLLSSSDESVIDQNFTFTGTYTVNPDGTAKATVDVVIAPGVVIHKTLWFVIHSVGKDGVANGFAGGHADADLGDGVHGNTRTHQGWRINTSK